MGEAGVRLLSLLLSLAFVVLVGAVGGQQWWWIGRGMMRRSRTLLLLIVGVWRIERLEFEGL